MSVLTGNRCDVKPCQVRVGSRKGSHSTASALISSPPVPVKAFSFGAGFQPCIRRGLTGRNTGQPLLWARPERAERVAKAAPEVERLPGMRGSVTENALKASPINFGLAEYRSPSWKCLKP